MTRPNPYIRGPVTLYRGDCLEILPGLEADALISDPPYGMDNDCDYSRFTGGPNSHGEASSRTYAPVIGDDKPFDPTPFLSFARVVLWGFNHFASRLPVGTTLVWLKRMDGGFGSFLSDAEMAWMKGGCGVFCKRDTTLFGETHNRLHPTQKPVGIMEWCIEKNSDEDDTILDPFTGSGTTAIACIRTGRRFIGCEIDPKYWELACARIDRELDQGNLFEPRAERPQARQLELCQ